MDSNLKIALEIGALILIALIIFKSKAVRFFFERPFVKGFEFKPKAVFYDPNSPEVIIFSKYIWLKSVGKAYEYSYNLTTGELVKIWSAYSFKGGEFPKRKTTKGFEFLPSIWHMPIKTSGYTAAGRHSIKKAEIAKKGQTNNTFGAVFELVEKGQEIFLTPEFSRLVKLYKTFT